MTEYKFEVTCESCGARRRFVADQEPEQVECLACGADAFAISLIGTRFEP